MNKKQINKMRMYGSVDLVFDNHAELVAQYDELAASHKRLKTGLELIGQNRQVQEVNSTGLTRDKIQLRADLEKMISQFAAGLIAYGTSVKNEDLKTKAGYAPSTLKKVSDSILFDIGTLLNGLAVERNQELEKFFLGKAEFAEIARLLGEFKTAIPRKRVAASVSKVSTENISDVFSAQDKLLRVEIDALMHPFQFTKPDFFNAYKNARNIIDYSGRGKGKQEPKTEKAF